MKSFIRAGGAGGAKKYINNLKKLEKINERSLRFVFNDNDSNYMQLLNRVGQPSLFNGRVHYILTLVYKSLNGLAPEYITTLLLICLA